MQKSKQEVTNIVPFLKYGGKSTSLTESLQWKIILPNRTGKGTAQAGGLDWLQSPVTKYFFLIILFDNPLK